MMSNNLDSIVEMSHNDHRYENSCSMLDEEVISEVDRHLSSLVSRDLDSDPFASKHTDESNSFASIRVAASRGLEGYDASIENQSP